MPGTRTKVIVFAAIVAVGGGAAYLLTSGKQPILQIAQSDNVIKLEAAGIEYSGWPEMALSVNGQQIAVQTIDNKVRQVFEFNVPGSVGEVETIEARLTTETNCKEAVFLDVHQCTDRTLILRKLWLNDEQIKDPVATGEGNHPWSLTRTDGEVTWTVSN